MPDNPAESAGGGTGAQATPTPDVSATSSGQQSSSGFGLDDATVEKLLAHPKFKDHLARTFQSAKDRRISTLEQAVADLKAGKATPAQVQQAVAELEGGSPSPASGGTGAGAGDGRADDFKSATSKLLSEWGIPPDDPDLLAMAAKPYASREAWYVDVATLGARRVRQGAVPASAAVVDTAGTGNAGARTRTEQREKLTGELDALMKAPIQNHKAIAAKAAELRAVIGS